LQQGLARLPDLLAVQRAMAGLEGSIGEISGQIERAQATIAESRRQIQHVTDLRVQEASTDLIAARGKLAETEERLRAATDVVTRREIVAPEAGTVVNLRLFTVGAVLRPGDPVMDLMPENDRLVAEVNVSPNDIDTVVPGLRAEIRLPAFKQRLVPYLHGQVTWVAADVSLHEVTHQPVYRAHIAVDAEQLARLPGVFLAPGMPVEGHILVGERSFFRYLAQPVLDSFHRAFQEQ
jgi:HlyD family secretion protein